MWPTQLAFLRVTLCRMFLFSLTQHFISHTIGPNDLLHPSPAPHLKTFQVRPHPLSARYMFQHHTKLSSKWSTCLFLYFSPITFVCNYVIRRHITRLTAVRRKRPNPVTRFSFRLVTFVYSSHLYIMQFTWYTNKRKIQTCNCNTVLVSRNTSFVV